MDMSDIKRNIEILSDEELSRRVAEDYFNDDAKKMALAEIKSRGLPEPSEITEEKKESYLKRHPLISIVILGLVAKVVMEVIQRITH